MALEVLKELNVWVTLKPSKIISETKELNTSFDHGNSIRNNIIGLDLRFTIGLLSYKQQSISFDKKLQP